MTRPRAADDFTTIRARMEELRREREAVAAGQEERPGRRPDTGENAERRRRERIEGWPPPWVPTIFVRRSRG